MSIGGSGLLPIVEPEPDFLSVLLREQQSMTAVEQFSHQHTRASGEYSDGPAQERYYRRLMPATPPGPNQQYAFEVDLDACSGCKACVVACHTLNGLEEHETWRRVGALIGDNTVQHVTTACHHCEDPACLSGCPVKAYVKDEATGIVRHLDDQCIGCKYCTMMCPYEVPQYSERLGIVRKCDMCHQRLSVGEAPACVQACPNEAIRIGVFDHTAAAIEGKEWIKRSSPSEPVVSRLAPGAPDSSITRPTTRFLSKRPDRIDASRPQDAAVDPVADSHWPLAVMLVATQAAIGVVLVERTIAGGMAMGDAAMPGMTTRIAATLGSAIAALGMSIAPLHLGRPLKAWRVFLGLKTSWLSREAVVLGAFVGLLSGATVLLWLPLANNYVPARLPAWIPAGAAPAMLGASLGAGAAGLYVSAMIYIATGRRLWRFQRTMIRFAGSAIFLGLVGFAWVSCLSSAASWMTIGPALCALAVAAVKMAFETATHYAPAVCGPSIESEDARSARLATGPLRRWLACRRAAAVASMLLLAAAALSHAEFENVEQGGPTAPVFLAGAFAVSLAGEVAERLLYFASVVYDRMPGTLR